LNALHLWQAAETDKIMMDATDRKAHPTASRLRKKGARWADQDDERQHRFQAAWGL
jgi:hypothetical protein